MNLNHLNNQLKEAGQLTGIDWAICVERSRDWETLGFYNIVLRQRILVINFLKRPYIESWLDGAFNGKQGISRKIPKNSGISGKKLYVFPNQITQRLILVCANNLSKAAVHYWGGVSLGSAGQLSLGPEITLTPMIIEGGKKSITRSISGILNKVLQVYPCQGGWLATKAGDNLEIITCSKSSSWNGKRLSISAEPLINFFCQTRKARIVLKQDEEWAGASHLGVENKTQFLIGLPLLIEKRVFGIVALWGIRPPPDALLEKLMAITNRLTPTIERFIINRDLNQQFLRMGLMKEFVETIHSSLDLDQMVQRTFAFLHSTFSISRIFFVTLFPADSGSKYYFERGGLVISEDKPGSTLPAKVIKGETFRTDMKSVVPYNPIYPGSKAAMITPIRLRKRVIGALGLENENEGAFTFQEEHFLMVVASHLSALLENGWLRQEAEARVRNLGQIREIIMQVAGCTDVRRMAQLAAEIISHNFDGELVIVSLERGPNKELQIAGISGIEADLVQKEMRGLKLAIEKGTVKRVSNTGKSVLTTDVSKDTEYVRIANWDAGSEMCVAIKNGSQTFGVVDVESRWKNAFSQTDLQVLESMAGIIAGGISTVGQYQKLQMVEKQMLATQEDLKEHIAAQRMAERRLVQAAKLAAVGEMAAGIAHELNNPLTTVSGFTELTLEEVPPNTRLHADLQLVLREAHRATEVVRRLLDFARQSESTRARCDINEIAKEVLALVNHLLKTSGVQLSVNFPNGLPLVSVDRNQVKQVLLNLIHNALHAMPNGGEILISSARRSRDHQDWLMVSVKDSGVGISPENLEKIFVPFFTTRAKEGGTGLGLSISYGLIAEHGGFIEAESQARKRIDVFHLDPGGGKLMAKTQILIVDDEPGITRLCERLLTRTGYGATAFTDPAAAMTFVENNKIDLLLVDIRMPGISGFDLIAHVKQHQPDTAVLVMTGYGTIDTAIQALREGVDGLLLKPFDSSSELVLSVKQALDDNQKKRDIARIQALRPLFDVTETFLAETNPERLVNLIVSTVCDHLLCKHAGYYQYSENDKILKLLMGHGITFPEGICDPEKSIIGKAHDQKSPIWINVNGSSNQEYHSSIVTLGLSSVFIAPVSRLNVDGMLYAGRESKEVPFREVDWEMFLLMTGQAAVAMENAWLYQELREYIRRMEESQNALVRAEKLAAAGRLTASIAHEINNPLQAVQNCLHLATRGELSAKKQREYIDLANHELDRLRSTVKRMLDFYRPGSVEPQLVNLAILLQRVIKLLSSQLAGRNIRTVTRLSTKLPPILAVSSQLEQVFINLILNSYDAMPEGGDLKISARRSEDMIEVLIQDSGPGISEEYRSRIFEPFVKYKNRRDRIGTDSQLWYYRSTRRQP